MKKCLFLCTLSLTMVATIGCAGGRTPAMKEMADSVGQKSAVQGANDSLLVDSLGKSFSDDAASVDFSCDFPVSGPRVLVDSLRTFLSKEMAGCVVASPDDQTVAPKTYNHLADGKGMIAYYADATFKSLKSLGKGDEEVKRHPYSISLSVNKVYDTVDYVTYTSVFSLYEGGAHGMASLRGVTFDKKSGSQIGYPVDSTALKALQPILREGVKSYFVDVAKNDGESVSDTDIKDFMDGLFIENGIIPLPAAAPYLSPDGVVFVYGQYEIGAYAIGMPTFTVPYGKIEKYLTPEVRRLTGLK